MGSEMCIRDRSNIGLFKLPTHPNLLGICYQIRIDCKSFVESLLIVEMPHGLYDCCCDESYADARDCTCLDDDWYIPKRSRIETRICVCVSEQFRTVERAKEELWRGSGCTLDEYSGVVYFAQMPELGARTFEEISCWERRISRMKTYHWHVGSEYGSWSDTK